jgi:hypothetical protein
VFPDPVEHVHHFDMRKLAKIAQRTASEPIRVKQDPDIISPQASSIASPQGLLTQPIDGIVKEVTSMARSWLDR